MLCGLGDEGLAVRVVMRARGITLQRFREMKTNDLRTIGMGRRDSR